MVSVCHGNDDAGHIVNNRAYAFCASVHPFSPLQAVTRYIEFRKLATLEGDRIVYYVWPEARGRGQSVLAAHHRVHNRKAAAEGGVPLI